MNHTLDPVAGVLTLTVPGDILSTNADPLREQIFQLLGSEAIGQAAWGKLQLNLTAARMVDSVGLNLVVALIKAVKQRGATVQVNLANKNVQRTFMFTRLDQQVDLVMA